MRMTNRIGPSEEAENCRRQALAYVGMLEGPFLLRIAEAFEALAHPIGSVTSRAGSNSPPQP